MGDLHTLDMTDSKELPEALAELSALENLTKLSLASTTRGIFQAPWLFQLKKLGFLHLCCDRLGGVTQHTLTDQLLLLSRLQHLSVKLDRSGSCLSLYVAWDRMRSLSTIKL